MDEAAIGSMKTLGITESYKLKRQVVLSATEAAEMIIRFVVTYSIPSSSPHSIAEWTTFFARVLAKEKQCERRLDCSVRTSLNKYKQIVVFDSKDFLVRGGYLHSEWTDLAHINNGLLSNFEESWDITITMWTSSRACSKHLIGTFR